LPTILGSGSLKLLGIGGNIMSELSFASATELAEKIQNKDISAVELLNHYLERVDRFNGDLNAVVVDTREQA
jgi:Asp-tRNA(Asn)/Glu-tRNA(Gln) amidotransferase A subunit family amidase